MTSSWNCRQDKTLITHARTGAARFLGYEITVQHADRKITRGRRSVNGAIALRVPTAVIKAKCAPYLQARQTRAPARAGQRRRLHHRQHLRGRVPGHRPVLPAGRGRLPAEPAALGHGDLDAQDPGRQAPLDGDEDGPQVQGHHRAHRTGRARASRPASNAAAGSHWSHGSAASRSNGRRTRSSPTASRPGHHPPQGAGHPAPARTGASSASSTDERAGPPRPQARRPRQAGTTTARVGAAHGQTAAQDPRGLRRLPRRHPRRQPTATLTE